jgi:hypothetical protein
VAKTKTLLQIVTAALGEIGLPAPTAIVGNRDGTALQCLALLNAEGEELSQVEGGWPGLRGEQLITLVPGQEAYDFPDDILYYRSGAGWDRTSHWQAFGPLSASQWQLYRSGLAISTPWPGLRYRVMNGQVHFDPVPGTDDTIVFEYVSSSWVLANDETQKEAFTADTDIPLIPDRLLIMALKWRLLAAKGMNYAEERAAYDLAVLRAQARSETAPVLALNLRRMTRFDDLQPPITIAVPDTDANLPDEANGDPIPPAGSGLPYLSGGVRKYA